MKDSWPLVWIVIPTWNRQDDILACLASVETLDYIPKEILVVDNGSTDDTVTTVSKEFPNVNILSLPDNVGAANASNAGFTYAIQQHTDYILRLDSDTILSSSFLKNLVLSAVQSPQVGLLVGKVYYYDDPQRIWSIGALQKSWDLGAIELARGKIDGVAYEQEQEVDYGWAAGMLLTPTALRMTNGFDPDFFVYYEEVDLCCRLRKEGLQIRSVPSAKMWHKVGQSIGSYWVAYQWGRGKMLFFRKNSHGLHKMLLIVYAYLYALLRGIFPKEKGGNRGPMTAALKGLTSGLRHPLSKQ